MRLVQNIYTFIFLLFFCFSSNAAAQDPHIRFKSLGISEGLSQGTVTSILQDKTGFMWFGTNDGLNRYDGYEFRIFRHSDMPGSNSISNNKITCLYEDDYNNLWIGTEDGLNKFDPLVEKFYAYGWSEDSTSTISDYQISTIIQADESSLWVGTNRGGVYKFNIAAGLFGEKLILDANNSESKINNNIRALMEDTNGQLWVGTQGGLVHYDDSSGQSKLYTQNEAVANIARNSVTALARGKNGNIWVGSQRGFSRFDTLKKSFTPFVPSQILPGYKDINYVTTMLIDGEHGLWVGAYNNLFYFDAVSEELTPLVENPGISQSLSDRDVFALEEDRSGVIWVGTQRGGVNIYDPHAINFELYRNVPADSRSLTNNIVRWIYEDDDNGLLIATQGGGLNKFNRTNRVFQRALLPGSVRNRQLGNVLWSVIRHSSGDLLIGNRTGGLYRLDRQGNILKNYRHNEADTHSLSSNTISTIMEDRSGTVWIGTTHRGLNVYDAENDWFRRYEHNPNDDNTISSNDIFSLYQDAKGNVWVGTINGLNRVDLLKEKFTRIFSDPNDEKSLSMNKVSAFNEDLDGNLWIGTYGGGLNKFDYENETFIRYTGKDGLPNDVIYAILTDMRGFLWISTNNGISRFDPVNKVFDNFNESDGLQGREFNMGSAVKMRSGELAFGGMNGLNIFNPAKRTPDINKPRIVLTSVKVFNESVELGEDLNGRVVFDKAIHATDNIELEHDENVITLKVSALSYSSSQKNRYAYMIEGIDRDWNNIGNMREIPLTYLSPGNYLIKIRGANIDGVWSDPPLSLNLIINPPFWLETWFILLGVVSILGAFAAAHKLRTIQLKNQKINLEKEVRKRTTDLVRKGEELEAARQSLDVKVNERTMELTESNEKLNEEISERKKVEEILQENQRALSTLMSNLPGVVYRTKNDDGYTILFLSEGCFELTGHKPQEFVGKKASRESMIHPEDRANHAKKVRKGMEKKKSVEDIYRIIDAKKNVKWVADFCSGVYDKQGKLLYIDGFLMDVTDKIETENREIEARAMTENASRLASMSTLAAGIAHEINQPLSALKVKVDSILFFESQNPGGDSGKITKDLEFISHQADRVEAIIKHMRSLMRQDKTDEKKVTDINKSIKKTLHLINYKLVKNDIDVVFDLQKNLPEVSAYPTSFEQVIVNLVINAVNALENKSDAGRKITIMTRQVGDKALIEVSDNGTGIAEEDMSKIFDPFFSTKAKEGNMGLGLSITQNIVRSFGGDILAKNNSAHGTTIRVELPVHNSGLME